MSLAHVPPADLAAIAYKRWEAENYQRTGGYHRAMTLRAEADELERRHGLEPGSIPPAHVDLLVNFESQNGSFTLAPRPENHSELIVGLDWDWHNAVGVFTHEALEFILTVDLHRYRQADAWGMNHAEYIFHFDHQAFTRATDMLGHFIADALVKVCHAYGERNKELRKRGLPLLGKDEKGNPK